MNNPFQDLCENLAEALRNADIIETKRWQSTDANPNALRMREVLHVNFAVDIPDDPDQLDHMVQPFQPWAEKHFQTERVSGHPINPGETFKEWRYPASAHTHKDFEFSHSYAERYWPKYAGCGNGGRVDEVRMANIAAGKLVPNFGIRHSYGDLSDLVALLVDDLHTRQAYLPIFFPEDLTAARKRERIPCTLGYHFIVRNNTMDVVYPMRSCDFVRHFCDDVYLTGRLLQWVVQKVNENAGTDVVPGKLFMRITSLHCFESDTL